MIFKKLFRRIFWRKRGTGRRPNMADPRDLEYLPGKGSSAPKATSLEKFAKIVDQRRTSSCVGNAIAGAVYIMERKSGKKYGYPSRLFSYWNARRRHGKPPLKDGGTYVRSACKALQKIGIPDENDWPFKTRRVNDKPAGYRPWAAADPRSGGEYVAIKGGGQGRVNGIIAALSDGYPVVFGTDLGKTFMSASGPDVIDRPKRGEKIVGGHAMVIIGHRTVLGEAQLRVLNSWGKRWRDGGLCWFTEDYIKWVGSGDFTIIRGWARVNP